MTRSNLELAQTLSNYNINYEEILLTYYAGLNTLQGKDVERLKDIFYSFLKELERIYFTKKSLESKYISNNYFFPCGLNNKRVIE